MRTFFFLYFLCAFAICLNSQNEINDDQSKDTIYINEVVITASKISALTKDLPYNISVISRQQIEQSSESALLPVLSEQVSGLFVSERGVTGFGVANGAAGQISIRGVGGNPNTQVLVLLNGSPQYMGIMGHPLADSYVASDADKVEIMKGPASTLYGSNAMGGVINIITRKQKSDGYSGNASVIYGSYNTQKYMINGGIKKNNLNIFASLNHDQTNGHRDSSDFNINNGYIKAGYDFLEKFSVTADFSIADFNATDPGPETGKAGYEINITRGMGSISTTNKFEKFEGEIRLFYNFGEHNITDGFHSIDENYGIAFNESFRLIKGNVITVGTDFKKFGGMAENLLAMNGSGLLFGDTMNTETGVYLLSQQKLFKKITASAGIRYELSELLGYEPVPTVGLSYEISTNMIFKTSISKGFRNPTIRELYLWGTANPDLKPERMMNYEIGICRNFLSEKIKIEISVFRSEGSNMIQPVLSENLTKYINTGSFENTGVDFSGKYIINKHISAYLNYNYIYMNEPVISVPEQQFGTGATFTKNKITLYAGIQYIYNLILTENPEIKEESYLLVNSRISYKIHKNFGAFIKAENILNEKYQINYNYPMPGICFYGGVNLNLK